jgi:hypothetical protein
MVILSAVQTGRSLFMVACCVLASGSTSIAFASCFVSSVIYRCFDDRFKWARLNAAVILWARDHLPSFILKKRALTI